MSGGDIRQERGKLKYAQKKCPGVNFIPLSAKPVL